MPEKPVTEETKPTTPPDSETTETPTETPEAKPELREELSGFDGNQLLLGLMADKDVQTILNARREGRPTKVTVDPDETSDEDVVDDDLEDLDDDVKKVLSLVEKRVAASLKPLTEDVGVLKKLASNLENQGVQSQIEAIGREHKDFPKYRKEMAKISNELGGGLGIKELYLLAKSRAGDLSMSEPSTHSERPTPTPRSKLNKDTKAQSERGRKGFKNTLGKALAGLDLSPQE